MLFSCFFNPVAPDSGNNLANRVILSKTSVEVYEAEKSWAIRNGKEDFCPMRDPRGTSTKWKSSLTSERWNMPKARSGSPVP